MKGSFDFSIMLLNYKNDLKIYDTEYNLFT